jgi:hypothetical protein
MTDRDRGEDHSHDAHPHRSRNHVRIDDQQHAADEVRRVVRAFAVEHVDAADGAEDEAEEEDEHGR